MIATLERIVSYAGGELGKSLVSDGVLSVVEGLGLFDDMMEYLN